MGGGERAEAWVRYDFEDCACDYVLVAEDVCDELLGGGYAVVGLEAVHPVLHDFVEEVDDGAAVARLGSYELDHEVFVHRRDHGEEVPPSAG